MAENINGLSPKEFLVYNENKGDFLPTDLYFIKISNFKNTINYAGLFKGKAEDEGNGTVIPTGCLLQGSDLIIPIQFLNDVKITDRNAAYSSVNILGRYEPLEIFQSSSHAEVNVQCVYAAMNQDTMNEIWVNKIVSLIRSLTTLTYYGNYQYMAPPRVFLKIGKLVDNIPVYLKSFSRSFEDAPKSANNRENNTTTAQGTILDTDFNRNNDAFLPFAQKLDLGFSTYYKATTKVDSTTIALMKTGVSL
jgi:hypothetical protein